MGLFESSTRIDETLKKDSRIVLAHGDSAKTLAALPDGLAKLIISSPPYNIGKEYEVQVKLDRSIRFPDTRAAIPSG